VPHDVVIRNRELQPDAWRIVGLAPFKARVYGDARELARAA